MGSGWTSRLPAGPRLGIVDSLGGLLGPVLGPAPPAVGHSGRVERGPDDLVPHPRDVSDPAPPDEHDGVLLEVVADAGDVRGDLGAAGEANPGNLPESRVGLLGGNGVDARADTPALGRPLERRSLRPAPKGLPSLPHQLLYRRHTSPVFLCVVRSATRGFPSKTGPAGPGDEVMLRVPLGSRGCTCCSPALPG